MINYKGEMNVAQQIIKQLEVFKPTVAVRILEICLLFFQGEEMTAQDQFEQFSEERKIQSMKRLIEVARAGLDPASDKDALVVAAAIEEELQSIEKENNEA